MTREEKINRVIRAIEGTDLDCSTWHPDAIRELAELIVDALESRNDPI